MKRNGMEILGEDLRRRKLSAEEVQGAVDRAWRLLQAQSGGALTAEVLRDLKPASRPARNLSRAVWLVPATALLAVTLLVSLWPRAPQASLESSGGAGRVIPLPDGSRVELLSADAEIFLESSDAGRRIRLNRGSIRVIAAKQRAGSLSVVTKDLTASVVGTVFLVSVVKEGSRVTVIEGEVRVLHGETATRLLRGEEFSTAQALVAQQENPKTVVSPPTFEVVAIRASPDSHTGSRIDAKNERVTIENMNLRQILRYAYAVEDYQISGPGKLTTDRYYIDAKAPAGTPNSSLYPMLQPMLLDRFKMVLKRGMRSTSVYALRQTSGGIKVKELAAGELSSGRGGGDGGGGVPGMATSTHMGTMENLAISLSRRTDRPVVDRTGLTGRYAIALRYVPDSARQDGVVGPSLDTALEEIGLKLDRVSVPMEFLEVEEIQKPTPN